MHWTEEQYLAMTDHVTRPIEYTDGFLEKLPWPTDRHGFAVDVNAVFDAS